MCAFICISSPVKNLCKYIYTWQGQPLLPPQWFPQGSHAPCVPGNSLFYDGYGNDYDDDGVDDDGDGNDDGDGDNDQPGR